MICNSCKTSYNVLSRLGSGSNCAYGAGGGGIGGLIVDMGGGVMQNKKLASLLFIYEWTKKKSVPNVWLNWTEGKQEYTEIAR